MESIVQYPKPFVPGWELRGIKPEEGEKMDNKARNKGMECPFQSETNSQLVDRLCESSDNADLCQCHGPTS